MSQAQQSGLGVATGPKTKASPKVILPAAAGGEVGSDIVTTYHEGSYIDYTPNSDTPAGTIVDQGGVIGLADNDIMADHLGALAIEHVVKVPIPGESTAFAVGDAVHWDGTTALPTGGTKIGTCVTPAASGDSYVLAKLLPVTS